MSRARRTDLQLDLDALPPEMSAALEAVIAGESVTLTRSGWPIGALEFRSEVLEGAIVSRPDRDEPPAPVPEGVTVVATAMKLSEAARSRFSDAFGPDYVVLDMLKAPPSTDVLLVNPISPQLLGRLQDRFPQARVVVVEIEDEDLGVHYAGPVSRLLDAGARAYLPPRPIDQVAAGVHAYLTQGGGKMLEAGPGSTVVPGIISGPDQPRPTPDPG